MADAAYAVIKDKVLVLGKADIHLRYLFHGSESKLDKLFLRHLFDCLTVQGRPDKGFGTVSDLLF